MTKTVICPACNAKNVFEEGKRTHCAFCGMELSFVSVEEETVVPKTPKEEAIAFNSSLMIEASNGSRLNITSYWANVYGTKGAEQKLIAFYNAYYKKIEFAIELFNALSDKALFEIGEFNRSQMNSIISFRNDRGLPYSLAVSSAQAHIKSLQYEKSGMGLFNFAGKKAVQQKINRTRASIAVLEYEYATVSMEKIIKKYSALIDPLKLELSGVAKTAFKRRSEITEKLKMLEAQKAGEILKLNLKVKTLLFKKATKKFQIKYERLFDLEATREAASSVCEKPNYDEMDTPTLIGMMDEVLESLSVAITGSDSEKCKDIYRALQKKAPSLLSSTYDQMFNPGALIGKNLPFTDEMMKGAVEAIKVMMNQNKEKYLK